ncbi:hypothetical protein SP2UMMC_02585 [Streptococcus pneumoniae DAR3264]|nr:hypothetical protein SP2UMMC_02585 [Streptococcus pneumoniae DAR3264]
MKFLKSNRMLFSKINMVYNQYKKHQNEQGGI